MKEFPSSHDLNDHSGAFWNLLIYQVKKRERDRLNFYEDTDQADKTLAEIRKAFEENNP